MYKDSAGRGCERQAGVRIWPMTLQTAIIEYEMRNCVSQCLSV